jgi:hypothetical protein
MEASMPFHTPSPARAAADALRGDAEAVCRRLLSAGRREGRVWRVGDVGNSRGRSLAVALAGPQAGRWIDHATGERGDLLDLVAMRETSGDIGAAIRLVRSEFGLTAATSSDAAPTRQACDLPTADTIAFAHRLWAHCGPIPGTLAEAYLRSRSLPGPFDGLPLRFHPALPYRAHPEAPFERHPALVAAVTDRAGRIIGIQRTWLDPLGGKARLVAPRRSLGRVLGHAVRVAAFDGSTDHERLVVGEGLETVLSLRDLLPGWSLAACLSAGGLAAFAPPAGLLRLLIARDGGAVGLRAARRLAARMREAGVEATILRPFLSDADADRMQIGVEFLRMRAMILAPPVG